MAHRLHAHLKSAEVAGEVSVAQSEDLLACLCSLHAMVSLHFLTEEENYFALVPDTVGDS